MPCMRCGLQLIALALFAGCGAGREQRVPVSAPMVIVASFHKSLTGLMQTSIVLVQGEQIDMERLQLALDGFETTSTSSLLVASMNGARRGDGPARPGADRPRSRAEPPRGRADGRAPRCPAARSRARRAPGRLQPRRKMVLVDVTGLWFSGYTAADWLYEHRRVGAEHHDLHHLMFVVTVADVDGSVDRLVAAMHDLVEASPRDARQRR